jgi:O-antigen/teichoic acid export membrane protein
VRSRAGWVMRGVAKAVAIAVAAVVFIGVFSWGVMLLWNYVVPPLFHGPLIGYWQALALLVLSRILFGGLRGWRSGHGHWRRHAWRERWESLTPEERARLRERFCGSGRDPSHGQERAQS